MASSSNSKHRLHVLPVRNILSVPSLVSPPPIPTERDVKSSSHSRTLSEQLELHRWVEGVGRWSDVIGGSFGLCVGLWWEGRRREGRNHSRWRDDVCSVIEVLSLMWTLGA